MQIQNNLNEVNIRESIR